MARGAIAYKGQLYLGGSKVEANPTGSATGGNLSKLGVDDTVYAIPQVNNGTLTIQKNGTNVATFSANQSENVTANIDVSEDIAGTNTVSGNPITLTDASETYAEALSVELEPKQDLHGQDAPYVGGAGKNKLPMTVDGIKAINTVGTWSGNVYTVYNVTIAIMTDDGGNVTGIKVNGTSSGQFGFYLAGNLTLSEECKLNGAGDGSQSTYMVEAYNGTYYTSETSDVVLPASSGYEVYIAIRSGATLNNKVFYPMIRLSTETDPTFAPYSNICPITGYTECEVDDVGKNKLNLSDYTGNSYAAYGFATTISGEDVTITLTNYPMTGATESFEMLMNTDATFDKTGLSIKAFISAGSNYVSGVRWSNIQSNNNIAIDLKNLSQGLNATITMRIMVYDTSSGEPTVYEPYHSSNATIQFGQTVYGGRSNFTEGGTDDEYTSVDMGTLSWEYSAQYNVFGATVSGMKLVDYNTKADMYCECFDVMSNASLDVSTNGIAAANGSSYVLAKLEGVTDATTFTNIVNGLKLCYEKATASHISTPPSPLKLLKGTNNITTNGTTINLGYQPDNSIGDAVKASEEYTDRRMDALGDLAYINEDGDNSTKFLRGDGTWQNTPAGVTTLAALTDTTISSPSNGQVLKYDGSKWVNSADYSLPKASASTLGGVKVGANLSIDADGVLSATGGGANSLKDLTDVSAASPQNKQVLVYDSSQSKWVAVDADVVAIPRSYWSSTTRELDFMITVPAYNTQRILKFSLMHAAGLAASEYMFALDRGDVYSSKMAGDTCGISSSYSSSTYTYTITITMPSVSGSPNFIFAMTMYNGSEKTW